MPLTRWVSLRRTALTVASPHPHRWASSTTTTYAAQALLPSLPVPPLTETLSKYLHSVEPLCSPQALARTRAVVYSPANITALERLHAKLLARAATHRNWLERWWDGDQYLVPRDTLPINYNYFLRFKDEEGGSPPTQSTEQSASPPSLQPRQLDRAARLLTALAQFHAALAAEQLPADADRSTPLCMNQYARLFGHARVPSPAVDRMLCYTPRPPGLPDAHYATEYVVVPL